MENEEVSNSKEKSIGEYMKIMGRKLVKIILLEKGFKPWENKKKTSEQTAQC